MVPREAGRGQSFKGAGMYYLHDKDALTDERVGFTHTENTPTNDPHKALKWMAWTAIHAEELKRESGSKMTGRPSERPVFTFSLAWHPEEEPGKWDMIRAGRRALTALGLHEHETLMVSHTDRAHPHLHVIVNVIHPETGKASRLAFSRKKLSAWAEEYEREHGKIYCEQRVENNAKRSQAKAERDGMELPAIVTDLYHKSDSASAFQAALAEQGLTLATGKRLLVVDRQGKVYSLARQIEGVRARDINKRLEGIELPSVDQIRDRIRAQSEQQPQQPASKAEGPEARPPEAKAKHQPESNYFDRDELEQQWQESIIDAAIAAKPAKPGPSPPPRGPRHEVSPYPLNALQDRHLGELGSFYARNASARRKLELTHEQQHGAHERQLRRDITHLEGLLNNSGPARRLILRLTGQIPKDAPQELQNMRRTLENIEQRKAEAFGALDAQIEHERRAIETCHAEERAHLPPPQDDPACEHSPDADGAEIDPGEEFGPSLDY